MLTNQRAVLISIGHPPVPAVLEVRHGVAEALYLHGAHLGVEGEVGEVHGAGGLEGEHQSEASIVQSVDQPQASIVTLMVSLMLRNTSPVYMILRNWFSVVAWCIIHYHHDKIQLSLTCF